MTINMPDLDIGRCRNYRAGRDAYGNHASRRCLDYEAVSHQCSFEPDPERIISDMSWGGSSVFAAPKPKRWVKPGDVSIDDPDMAIVE